MPGSRSRGPVPLSRRDRRDGVLHALLRTLPGRAIVIGLVARIAIFVVGLSVGRPPAFLGIVDTVAGAAIAAGAVYFAFRLLVVAKRRLLWRVRRKLIISYIFIGLFPVILIGLFFTLCGLLLLFNVSSYLVQAQLRTLEDRARALATSAALEVQRAGGRDVAAILARRQATAASEFPSASFAIVPVNRPCGQVAADGRSAADGPALSIGPWPHVEPPGAMPAWIGCDGFSGLLAYSHTTGLTPAEQAQAQQTITLGAQRMALAGGPEDTHMFVRAAVFPESPVPGYAVVVDLLLDDQTRARLRDDTGVDIKGTSVVDVSERSGASTIRGRPSGDSAPADDDALRGPLNWITFLEYRDWSNGAAGTLLVSTQPSVSAIYQRISATRGLVGDRNSGQLLLVFLAIVGGLFLVIEGIALVAGLALAKSITGSVHGLFAGTERVRQGDFTHKIEVHSEDQLGELAGSFNSMTASIEDLLIQAAEKKRMEEELRIAREIQMSLLPQGPVGMEGLSISGLCVPAREVGGDYYDFFRLGERRLGVLIADVSGKGTSAALYMAELKGLVLSLSQIHTSPRALLLAANRIIAANLDARSFITMTYAVVDLGARTMTFARAGHTPLIYVPGPGSPMPPGVQVFAPDGLVLGLKIDDGQMFERLLEEQTIPLHAGDLAVFFTDGISEAMNESDDFFGEARLGDLAGEHAHLTSDELRERVLREIEAFVGAAPQHDDMTMILLKVDALPARLVANVEIEELAEI